MKQAKSLLEQLDLNTFHHVSNYHPSFCRALCQAHIPRVPSKGKSALAYGVESGKSIVVEQLVAAKADVNVPITKVA